jgi:hypothetical protein
MVAKMNGRELIVWAFKYPCPQVALLLIGGGKLFGWLSPANHLHVAYRAPIPCANIPQKWRKFSAQTYKNSQEGNPAKYTPATSII